MEKLVKTDHKKKALQAIILMMNKPPPREDDRIKIKKLKKPKKEPVAKE